MGNWAIVKGEIVTNVILWDGPDESPVEFEEGVTPVEVKDGQSVSPGYSYRDGEFLPPEPTDEDLSLIKQNEKDYNTALIS